MKPFKWLFHVRFDKLQHYNKSKPYLYRFVLVLFGYSIWVNYWVGEDVGPYLHNHASDSINIVLWGCYLNVRPDDYDLVIAPAIWFTKAESYHRIIPFNNPTITVRLCGQPRLKWGFDVDGKHVRPLEYFHRLRHGKYMQNSNK